MALATKCPHCKTTFRVASDQLKLRGGIVRCGTCHQVFDGNASLVDLDAPAVAPAPPAIPEPAWTPDPAAFDAPVMPLDDFDSDEPAAPAPDALSVPDLEFGVPAAAPAAAPASAPIELKLEADPDFDAHLDPQPAAEDDYIPSAGDAFDALVAAIDDAPALPKRGEYVLDFDLSEPVAPHRALPAAPPDHDALLPEPEPFVEAEFNAPAEELPEPEPFIEAEFNPPPEELPEPEPFIGAEFKPPPEELPEPEPFIEAEFNPPPEELPEPEPFVEEEFDTPEEALPEPEPFNEAEYYPPPAHELVPEPEPFSESEFGAGHDDDVGELSLADEPGASFSSEHPDGNTHAPDLETGPLPLLRASLHAPSHEPDPEPYPAAAEPYAADHDEPEFVRLAREKELAARRRRLVMGSGSVLLALALAIQVLTIFRNELAAKYPALKPAIAAVCAVARCKIELPSQIEAITVETGEFQTLSPTLYRYSTVLRNDSGLVQAWPHLGLALKDGSTVVVRGVFTPPQYLPPGIAVAKGFPPHSEQAVIINFELKQLKASGFDISVFYP